MAGEREEEALGQVTARDVEVLQFVARVCDRISLALYVPDARAQRCYRSSQGPLQCRSDSWLVSAWIGMPSATKLSTHGLSKPVFPCGAAPSHWRSASAACRVGIRCGGALHAFACDGPWDKGTTRLSESS